MSPIVQTLANSSAYGYRAFAAAGGDYESIATVTVGAGGASTVTFSSIPSTYQHLQIRVLARMGAGAGPYAHYMTFNSDSGSNYRNHYIYGSGASAAAGSTTAETKIVMWDYYGGGGTANIFGAGVIDLLDYQNTNKNKTTRNLGGYDANGSGEIFLSSGLWQSTSAISSITLIPESGNYAQYSSFALYGIKG